MSTPAFPAYDARQATLAIRIAALGASDDEITTVLALPSGTLAHWCRTSRSFARAYTSATQLQPRRVERALYKRALGYSYESVKIYCVGGRVTEVPYTEHVESDVRAAIFWLQNRQPERWRDNAPPEPLDNAALINEVRRIIQMPDGQSATVPAKD